MDVQYTHAHTPFLSLQNILSMFLFRNLQGKRLTRQNELLISCFWIQNTFAEVFFPFTGHFIYLVLLTFQPFYFSFLIHDDVLLNRQLICTRLWSIYLRPVLTIWNKRCSNDLVKVAMEIVAMRDLALRLGKTCRVHGCAEWCSRKCQNQSAFTRTSLHTTLNRLVSARRASLDYRRLSGMLVLMRKAMECKGNGSRALGMRLGVLFVLWRTMHRTYPAPCGIRLVVHSQWLSRKSPQKASHFCCCCCCC